MVSILLGALLETPKLGGCGRWGGTLISPVGSVWLVDFKVVYLPAQTICFRWSQLKSNSTFLCYFLLLMTATSLPAQARLKSCKKSSCNTAPVMYTATEAVRKTLTNILLLGLVTQLFGKSDQENWNFRHLAFK